MKKQYWVAGGAVLIAVVLAVNNFRGQARVKAESVLTAKARVALGRAGSGLVAGPGKVEPVSEDIKVGSELSGKLRSVVELTAGRIAECQVQLGDVLQIG